MLLSRLWIEVSARLAERRARGADPAAYETLIARHAPGRSFADVGGMYGIHGRNSFLAEEAGATAVTLFDAMPPSDEFEAERQSRKSAVRYVPGDLHAPDTPAAVGAHDVVWCTGLMYHTPSPLLAFERLSQMCGELMILGTKSIPEVPGVPGAAVLFPALDQRARAPYGRIWGAGPTAPYDMDPVRSYANWWWGFTRSAFVGMFGLGWDVIETVQRPRGQFHDDLVIVLRRRADNPFTPVGAGS